MRDGIVERLARGLPISLAAVCFACVCGCGDKPREPATLDSVPSTLPNALSFVERPVDLAWHFASSITDDPEDQAAYQAKVAITKFRGDGDVAAALRLAHSINRWNRGLVLAEVAESLARRGERERATAVMGDALEIAEKGIEQGWQRDRIRLALGAAEAMMGSEVVATDPAFVTRELDRMWESAQGVPGLMLFSAQMDVVDAALRGGQGDYAEGKLKALVVPMRDALAPAHMLLPVKTRFAMLLARTGQKAEAEAFAQSALAGIPDLLSIEQPSVLASAAAALFLADPDGAAESHFLEAIRQACELKNRRPRCKALCDIALSLHECGVVGGNVLSALAQASPEVTDK